MAAFDEHNAENRAAQRQESECPVCYEYFSDTERILSCGHVFCHDCLVKTLVCINRDGIVRDTIICPVCRHLTFIEKLQDIVVVPFASGKDAKERGRQTLKIPVPPTTPVNPEHNGTRFASPHISSPSGSNGFCRIMERFRCISERWRSRRKIISLINPDHCNSQIFIISAQGRPMVDDDVVNVDTVTVTPEPNRRRHIRICTTGRFLCVLLAIFTLMALVAVTLPWVLLA
ncbi:RING finger protein 222 [Esox lucius]|uniref:RING-type domain-containing protein n=1 Tax=Esox lucius TaxID=8010 RepID=A0AAY5L9F2_ESOLU|nr:RING finger protein 222 [Esox lucius]